MADLSQFDQLAVRGVRDDFPELFARASADWAKFKVGMDRGLFAVDEVDQVVDWFREFPRLWDALRPNWAESGSGVLSAHNAAFVNQVDRFVAELKGSPFSTWGVGLVPLVVAGVVIVGGIAAAIWAIGYVKKQNNVSALIDGVVRGTVPADVLNNAIKEQSSPGLIGDIGFLLKWGVIGVLVFMAWPTVSAAFRGKRA